MTCNCKKHAIQPLKSSKAKTIKKENNGSSKETTSKEPNNNEKIYEFYGM